MRIITLREALREAMSEEMRRDQRVFLLGEEVAQYNGAYKVSQGMLDEFGPDRVIDTPITEIGFTGLAVGAAFAGLRPIVEFMSFNFSMQAIDHIVNSAAKTLYMSGGLINCPIVFRGANGPSLRLAAQHSQCFASWYSHCPGLKVVAPYSAEDAKGLLKSSIRDNNPIVFLENELMYGDKFEVSDDPDLLIPIGKAKLVRPGKDVTIISFSLGMRILNEVIPGILESGIDPEIIDLRTLRPIDIESIMESIKKTNRVVIVEQGWPYAGIASEIAMQIMENGFDYLDAPIQRVTGADVPTPYAANLELLSFPSKDEILTKVKEVCYK